MSFRNFIYLIRLGLKNVWNNKVYAAAAVMSMASQMDMVRVMRLIGAREDFIRIPFIVEGLVLGIAGMCIPIALLYATYVYGIRFVDVHFGLFGAPLKLLPAGQVMPELIQASVALGVLTGIIGSIAVMGRLKSK